MAKTIYVHLNFGEPPPVKNDEPPVWGLVKEDIKHLVTDDMERRNEFGIQKYGTPLQANNGRDALKDAYEEALDLCVYLRQALYERDGR